MKFIIIKVYIEAIKVKIKKLFLHNYDPYPLAPKGIFLSPSLKVLEEYKRPNLALSFSKSNLDPKKWQTVARKKLSELSGYEQNRELPKVAIKGKIKEIEKNIFRRTFYLRVKAKSDIPINLIYNKNLDKKPSVFIFLAGSTSGCHIGWGEARVPIDHQRIFIGADIAKQAAKRGYLAITIEQAGYGQRLEKHLPQKSIDRTIDLANHLLLLGKSLMGNGASEISYIIDWLISDKIINIDKKKIFLYGHSSGGTLAQFAAALDVRIKGTLASGSVGPIRETIGSRGAGSGDGIIPGFLNWFDTEDLLALIAPRIFVGLSGDKDHIFPYSGVEKVVNATKVFYKKINVSKNINSIKVKGKHQYYNDETWKAWKKYIDP